MKLNLDDTIVAPATKITKQAISIIRISGPDAFFVANKIVKKPLQYRNDQQLRRIYEKEQLVDEALFITFANDNSFTGEPVVEINCHGGILVTKKIISLLISYGARMAMPGEFSQRAFLNGKINLLQAEGINNLIESRNELALKINAQSATGINDKTIINIKDGLIDIISKIQTTIDYPEYDDIQGLSKDELTFQLTQIKAQADNIITISERVFKVNDGLNTVILGEPNVGKSSLLNALLNEEKAIVTDIEGTTRDIVEGQINFPNFSLNLLDTAGIRSTNDKIEKIGIKKSLELIKKADLVILVSDKTKPNKELLEKIKNLKHILVFNKADKFNKKETAEITKSYGEAVFTNAKTAEIQQLLDRLECMWEEEELLLDDTTILTNIDNINQLKKASQLLNVSVSNLKKDFGIDMILIDLYDCLNTINTMLGIINTEEEILNNTFRKYCLGK